MRKPIIITMGDPTGVGPELILKALIEGLLDDLAHPLLVAGDVDVLVRAARIFGAAANLDDGGDGRLLRIAGRTLPVRTVSSLAAEQLAYGRPDAAAGRAMAGYVEWGVQHCLSGAAAALVTCPISKAAINAAGIGFPGHTELLAERCGRDKVVMMLAGETLKVCLVTTHLGYREVPAALTTEEILATLQIVDVDRKSVV